MNYADYQTYIIKSVWRVGDQDLTENLPQLMLEAEARINRDINDITLEASVTASLDSDLTTPLPNVFKQMRAVKYSDDDTGQDIELPPVNATAVPNTYFGWVIANVSSVKTLLVYLTRPAASNPQVTYTYYAQVTPYADDPATPFAEVQADFYKAAVLVQVYGFLKDDEAEARYMSMYTKLLESMTDDHYRRLNATDQVRAAGLGGAHW